MQKCGYAEYHPCIFVVSYYSDFGPSLLWYSYPPPCHDPAVWSLKFERYRARPWMILLIPGWLCARRSRARFHSHRSAQGHDCVATSVHFHVGSSPVSRPSTRSPQRPGTRVLQAGSLRRWRPPTFLFTPPNLKEDGKSPQSWPILYILYDDNGNESTYTVQKH